MLMDSQYDNTRLKLHETFALSCKSRTSLPAKIPEFIIMKKNNQNTEVRSL